MQKGKIEGAVIVPEIQSLKVKNFGVFKDKVFNFSNRLNVITGPNGTGKTTILTAIRYILKGIPEDKRFMNKKSKLEINLNRNILSADGKKYLYFLNKLKAEEVKGTFEYDQPVKKSTLALGDYRLFKLTELLDYYDSLAGNYALLIDDFCTRLDKEKREKVIEKLEGIRKQVIVATPHSIEKEIPERQGDKKITLEYDGQKVTVKEKFHTG